MDSASRVERYNLDDGRLAERHIHENQDCSGEGERVVEVYMEDKRPLRLSERVIEKKKPFVYERKIETLDGDGNVVEMRTESVEPENSMRMVEHLGVQSQSQNKNHHMSKEEMVEAVVSAIKTSKEEKSEDCHVTREEMVDAIVAAIKATKEEGKVVAQVSQKDMSREEMVDAIVSAVRTGREEPRQFAGINSLGLADEIAKRQEGTDEEYSSTDKIWMGAIVCLVIAIAYYLFV